MRGFLRYAFLYWLLYIGMLFLCYDYMKYVKGIEHPGETNTTAFAIAAAVLAIIIDSWRDREKRLKEEEK